MINVAHFYFSFSKVAHSFKICKSVFLDQFYLDKPPKFHLNIKVFQLINCFGFYRDN